MPLRSSLQAFKGADDWVQVAFKRVVPTDQAAVLLCDVWDDHWCAGVARRAEAIVPRMAMAVEALRAAGVRVIHAPSGVLDFYAGTPARERALAAPRFEPSPPLMLPDPPQPLDTEDGGCDTGEVPWHAAWTRQHSGIRIDDDSDFIAADGKGTRGGGMEVLSVLRAHGIEYLLYAGFATNMCVLNRSFGIKAMTRWGMRCVLIRDLTDAMYNPASPPGVDQETANALVVEYVERHWCPTVSCAELLGAIESMPVEGGDRG